MKISRLIPALLLFVTLSNPGANAQTIEYYSHNTVRIFLDPSGGPVREPDSNPPASILVPGRSWPKMTTMNATVEDDGSISIGDKGQVVIFNLRVSFDEGKTTVTFSDGRGHDYYGGGVQNGRYSHKGSTIAIENQNSWTDGGVSSPAPFFWSTAGYGILWNTFTKGTYSFGEYEVKLTHETPWLDIFVMLDSDPADILRDYYYLTGAPVLLPKFGFYEGHLNAYNRDFWKESPDGILFEDGKRYTESQSDNGGIKESLNGELPGNYQFSARAVIDRYEAADMPLGWILPNDGYGAGYGQAETLAGNVENLREFGDYAHSKGVEIGLWTQSDLHPVDTIPALLQRDIEAEIGVAGVRVLKTDVAWVYRGYSFGLNGIADAADIMRPHARPFIITLDGWAGTQRYGGIWSGDQTGGQWEYIRFHIPTYIGAGLSGQPNVGSDMDGIFGGGNEFVNIRDFQWKTFTPMELNMDGWGANEKYPQALGERAADINRRYLKLKSELMPYTYSIAWEATHGLPMIRAMELVAPEAAKVYTARYQFLYGPYLLVAPVYQDTRADADGNDVRNGIYLPEGRWIDYFTGNCYKGPCVIGNFDAPLDKLPVFMKEGAIIPMTRPHNNPGQLDDSLRMYDIFPGFEETSFTEYDDDGRSEAYLDGAYTTTDITCKRKDLDKLTINIFPTRGSFDGFNPVKATEIRIRGFVGKKPVKVKVNGKKVKSTTAKDGLSISISVPELDITKKGISISVNGLMPLPQERETGCVNLAIPGIPLQDFSSSAVTATSIDLKWEPIPAVREYSIDFNGISYKHIRDTHYLFEGLSPDTEYTFNGVTLKTSPDPLEWAISGIAASCTAPSQGGQEIERLFDLVTDGEVWHTRWYQSAVPFDITADLGAVYTLDKLEYVPRSDAGNGTILRGSVSTSADGKTWSAPVPFRWERSATSKILPLGSVQAAYVKIHVDSATGGFGSGRELLVFRVPGSGAYRKGVFNDKGEAVESID